MQSLPLFPKFRRYALDDREWYNAFFKEFEPYADFSYGNLIVWLDQYDDLLISRHEDNIILSSTVLFMESEQIITLLGKSNIEATLDAIFAHQTSIGKEPVVSGVTAIVAQNTEIQGSKKYIVESDRENFEYLYDTNFWATLEGSEIRKLRREVNTFEKEFGQRSSVHPLDLTSADQAEELKVVIASWSNTFSHNDVDRSESLVLDRLFKLAPQLPYKANGLYIDEKLEGFLIYQVLPQQTTACFSHVKASYNYRYMFDYLLHKSAQIALNQGITQINFEQDLGISGLRTHKESLKPKGFFEKFTIRPAVS
ncbi:DUF2156 domain-containing protein [Polaromonas sp.]|nr:DUF2156 domain-containing protein [Candidatus Saccharibacteria bacterium]